MSKSQLLVEKFDELVRHTGVLIQPIEPEFIRFVQNQEVCRKKWLSSAAEADTMRKDVLKLNADKSALEHQLKHSRLQLEKEMQRRHKAEEEAEKLGRQVALIKELLNDKNNRSYQQFLTEEDRERLAFLDASNTQRRSSGTRQGSDILSKQFDKAFDSSGSILSDTDISYDKTVDDFNNSHLRNGKRYSKRPSAPPLEILDSVDGAAPPATTSPKRQRTEGAGQWDGDLLHTERKHRRSRRMKRSISVGDPIDTNTDDSFFGISTGVHGHASHEPASLPQRGILKHPHVDSASPTLSSDSSAGPLRRSASASQLARGHNFISKAVIKPETCIHCRKKIFGMGLKCKDCGNFAHQQCKDRVPMPCVPTGSGTPTKAGAALISDYAPQEPPFVPLLMVQCVNEVENRGLTEVGIYRVPGAEKEVKELKERFLKNRAGANLDKVADIHVVCGCLKDFLRGLREPLLPTASWATFTTAAAVAKSDSSDLQAAILNLPPANRDSLAFLIRHLQRVAASTECKMSLSNLAKVFSPTIVGYSTPEIEPMQMICETKKQQEVMEGLLELPESFWDNILASGKPGSSNFMERAALTPDGRPVSSYTSLLGPLPGAGGITTPRTTVHHDGTASAKQAKYGSVTKRGFFASPMLK